MGILLLLIATVGLYSTKHYIGGSILLILLLIDVYYEIDDPYGLKALQRELFRRS